MKKLMIVLCLCVLNFKLLSQNNYKFDSLSKMVFDKINLERKKVGLLEYTWNDTLLILTKLTNKILKNKDTLYHPELKREEFDKYEKIFVNQYRKLTNNQKFVYESKIQWMDIRNYTQLGEVIVLINDNSSLEVQSNSAVNAWLNSRLHKYWLLFHNTAVYNVDYSPFCSCDSDYNKFKNQNLIIVTCKMYIINIASKYSLE